MVLKVHDWNKSQSVNWCILCALLCFTSKINHWP